MAQRRRWILLIVLTMLMLLYWRSGPAFATGATISLAPARVEIGMGETRDIEVLISNVTGLYGLDVILTFDPTIVEVVDLDPDREGVQVEEGQFPHPDYLAENEVVNDFGTIWYVASQMSPREPVSGSGTIMTIRFRGKSPGRTDIPVLAVTLSDSGGLEIPVEATTGGEIVVLEPGVTPAQPSSTPSPAATFTSTPLPSPTQEQPTATLEGTLPAAPTQGPSRTPTATLSTTSTQVHPTTTSTSAGAYPVSTPTAPQLGTKTPVEGASATVVVASVTRVAKPTVTLTVPSATPQSPTGTGPAQLTNMPAKVAAVIPTLEPAHLAEAQQAEQDPLIPEELFICLAVLLVLLTVALLFYLSRRARGAS